VIDGSEITHYPWERRAARFFLSAVIIFLLALFGAVLVSTILYLR
jgi:hypothetical protein